MVDKLPFNFPTELRDLTEQCIKAQTSYGQLMHGLTQAISAWSSVPSNTMAAGFNEVQKQAMKFATENAERSFALARDLASAKDLQDVISIQSQYAQTQIQTYASQVQELSRMTGKAMRGIAKRA